MIHENTLHVIKPDSPDFSMRLTNKQLKTVRSTLGRYGFKPSKATTEMKIGGKKRKPET